MSIWLPRRPLPIVLYHTRILTSRQSFHILANRLSTARNDGKHSRHQDLPLRRWESSKPAAAEEARAPTGPKPVPAAARDDIPKEPTLTRVWKKVKHEANHYWSGTKLLVSEVRISSRLQWKILQGETLTRREKRQVSITSFLLTIVSERQHSYGEPHRIC